MKQSSIKITIIGSGVVGQATGKGFTDKGFEVEFVDVNPKIVQSLKEEGYTSYLSGEKNRLDTDISFLTVPTPSVDGEIDLVYLKQAAKDLGKRLANLKNYHLVVVRSTVVPGTTEGVVLKLLEKYSGKKTGKDFGLCMNPEYLREASSVSDFANPWIVVFGQYDKRSGDLLEKVYARFNAPIHRISIKEAEIQKYVHNLFNAVKISFFNEIRRIGKALELDMETVFSLTTKSCEGIWNHTYGTKDSGPFSGSCLPKDTEAFLAWSTKQGLAARLLGAAIEVNNSFKKAQDKRGSVGTDDVALPL